MNTEVQKANEQREGFGTRSLVKSHETASSAVATQARALVEARYVMAMQRPRDHDRVRQSLLKECSRPSFANDKSALYHKPIGKGVEGLGIRFAETAIRCMTNIHTSVVTLYDDAEKRMINVTVTDLEGNVGYDQTITLNKTVERSQPASDGSYISMRKNSYNKDVFTVPANDDDLLNKEGALVSKAIRTLGLRHIPGDLKDECEKTIRRIRMDEAAKDPDAEKRKIMDAFGTINVTIDGLVEYLGHPLENISPAEIVELRGLFGAIRDEEATWASAIENKRAERADKNPDQPQAKGKADAVAARVAKKKGEKKDAVDPKNAEQTQPAQAPQGVAKDLPPSADGKPSDGFDPAGPHSEVFTRIAQDIENSKSVDGMTLILDTINESQFANEPEKLECSRRWTQRLNQIKNAVEQPAGK